jgi:hypothetical protein
MDIHDRWVAEELDGGEEREGEKRYKKVENTVELIMYLCICAHDGWAV